MSDKIEERPTTLMSERGIRRTSVQCIPSPSIPISILPSEGIASPRDSAHTPPGVLTKLESISRTRTTSKMSTEKLTCLSCKKRNQLICKRCTLEQLSFYSKRENITMLRREKADREAEVEAVFGEASSIHVETNDIRGKIFLLKRAIEEKKAIIQTKHNEIEKLTKQLSLSERRCTMIKPYIDKHVANETKMLKDEKVGKYNLDSMEMKIFETRKTLALLIFGIFPIRIYEAQPQPVDTSKAVLPESKKCWTVLDGKQESGFMYQVRDTYISDEKRDRLGDALQTSVLNLTNPLRSSFAALLHTTQLINILTFIYDQRLHCILSFRDLCLRDRWSKNSLDNDWLELCNIVMKLCLHIGMPAESLQFNYPHSNLNAMAAFILNCTKPNGPQVQLLNLNHRFDSGNAVQPSPDLISEWDILEDVDMVR